MAATAVVVVEVVEVVVGVETEIETKMITTEISYSTKSSQHVNSLTGQGNGP